ncbi:hypothetical protein, variant [Phialophora macrospora]|uniref:Uncharacterized protein n=1 Tax=Phialophora macrospora TaxID=1851006 RepID=A0A0D2D4T7_9EURO|nr:hypothetical protein PV04_00743 [Phialophora macrospora]KIW72561.1 hypothetical protein, variant [Phialophora macrospora]
MCCPQQVKRYTPKGEWAFGSSSSSATPHSPSPRRLPDLRHVFLQPPAHIRPTGMPSSKFGSSNRKSAHETLVDVGPNLHCARLNLSLSIRDFWPWFFHSAAPSSLGFTAVAGMLMAAKPTKFHRALIRDPNLT